MIHDDKVVLFGMSCVGKTTMASTMEDHHYHCFDSLFDWHSIETLGLSISTSLRHASAQCVQDRYVLDGWHLGDKDGEFLPVDCTVYVLYAPYEKIIDQYRVPVVHQESHLYMFNRWYYEVDYGRFPKVRFFENEGVFVERRVTEFRSFLANNR